MEPKVTARRTDALVSFNVPLQSVSPVAVNVVITVQVVSVVVTVQAVSVVVTVQVVSVIITVQVVSVIITVQVVSVVVTAQPNCQCGSHGTARL